MYLLSSWDEIDVHVELLADDVWSAKHDKTGFLNVGVDLSMNYDWKNYQFPCQWCQWVL